jgi:hypothetical protein
MRRYVYSEPTCPRAEICIKRPAANTRFLQQVRTYSPGLIAGLPGAFRMQPKRDLPQKRIFAAGTMRDTDFMLRLVRLVS